MNSPLSAVPLLNANAFNVYTQDSEDLGRRYKTQNDYLISCSLSHIPSNLPCEPLEPTIKCTESPLFLREMLPIILFYSHASDFRIESSLQEVNISPSPSDLHVVDSVSPLRSP